MPVSEYVHRELSPDGAPLFLIRTPNRKFRGRRGPSLGNMVEFDRGRGQTTSLRRAIWFAETMDYEVVLPQGHPGLGLASQPTIMNEPDEGEEDDIRLYRPEDPTADEAPLVAEDAEHEEPEAPRQPRTSRYREPAKPEAEADATAE